MNTLTKSHSFPRTLLSSRVIAVYAVNRDNKPYAQFLAIEDVFHNNITYAIVEAHEDISGFMCTHKVINFTNKIEKSNTAMDDVDIVCATKRYAKNYIKENNTYYNLTIELLELEKVL